MKCLLRQLVIKKRATFTLENHNKLTIHQRNLQDLMIEIHKILNGHAPPIMENFSVFRENVHNTILEIF